jgi:division/cell wall cluster transcriptional repressor MraZ
LARTLASRSDLVPWDSQGRIRIKDDLLNYADLTNQVVLVGTFDGFELWNMDQWNEQQQQVDQNSLGEAAQYVGF